MSKINLLLIVLIILSACSKEEVEISNIKEVNQEQEIITAYKEAYLAIDQGDPYFAAKIFRGRALFPQSVGSRSALMASYSYYLQNYYAEALANLERYVKTYPSHKDLVYAHYLIAMCYYETIEDDREICSIN